MEHSKSLSWGFPASIHNSAFSSLELDLSYSNTKHATFWSGLMASCHTHKPHFLPHGQQILIMPISFPHSSYGLPNPGPTDWSLSQGPSPASAVHSQPTQSCRACFFPPPSGLRLSGRSLERLQWPITLSTNPFLLTLHPSLLNMKPTIEHQAKSVRVSLPWQNKLHQNRDMS